MVTKTFSSYLPFVALLAFFDTCLSGKGPEKVVIEENAVVIVSVYNEAAVPGVVLSRAEQTASRVFERAGIQVIWLNCAVPAESEEASRVCREVGFPKHLHLRIVRTSAGLKGEAMGVSFQGEDGIGCLADLFYEPMLEKSDGRNVASLLGHVAAHEIGHLLLGTNSHAVAGIMQPRWGPKELTGAGMVFLDQESLKMKERLGGRPAPPGGRKIQHHGL